MPFLISFLWLLATSSFFIRFLDRRFETAAPVALTSGVLVLYLFAFFNQIRLGYWVSWAPGAFTLAVLLIDVFAKHQEILHRFLSKLLTPGLIACFALYGIVYLVERSRGFSFIDEFMHWGIMTAETLRTNGFYALPQSMLYVHKDYPPFFALLETLWCCFDGFRYSEGSCFTALVTFAMILFLPLLDSLRIRRPKDHVRSILETLSFLLVGLTIWHTSTQADSAHFYNSIYVDWALAMFAAYVIFFAFSERKKDFFTYYSYAVLFSALLIMKQMGLALYLLALMMLLLQDIVTRSFTWLRALWTGLSALAVPALFYLSWSRVIRLYELEGQFQISQIKISALAGICKGISGEAWQQDACSNFLSELMERPLASSPFPMTYFVYAAVVTAVLFCLLRFAGGMKKHAWTLPFVYLFGSFGYAFAMLLLYVFCFGEKEGPALASFDRYMISYLLTGTCLAVMTAFTVLNANRRRHPLYQHALVAAALCLFCDWKNVPQPLYSSRYISGISADLQKQTDRIDASGDGAGILVIEQYSKMTEDALVLRYHLISRGVTDYIALGPSRWDYDTAQDLSPEEWLRLLKNYHSVFTLNIDDAGVINTYWSQISEQQAEPEQLYQIQASGENVSVVLVAD